MNVSTHSTPVAVGLTAPFHRCPFDGVHEEVCFAAGKRVPVAADTRSVFCRTGDHRACPILIHRNP